MSNYTAPPNNLQAELSVIGGCLLSDSARDEVFQVLKPEHFYADDLREIYLSIREMHEAGKNAIDALTVAEWMNSKKRLESGGGPTRIVECMEAVPHAAHSGYYAGLVIEAALRRVGMNVGQTMMRDCQNLSEPPLDSLASAESAIHAAMETGVVDEPMSMADVLAEALIEMDDPSPKPKYIGTEWEPVEEFSSGVPLGGLVVLAARPSQGKTALSLSFGLRVAEADCPVLICQYEMPRPQLTQRCLSIVSGIDFHTLDKNKVSESQRHTIIESSSIMGRWPWFIDVSCRGQSGLMTMIRRMVRRHGIRLVIVDYLQLIEADNKSVNREQQISGLTRGLKLLAMKLNIGILCLSQLNRESEKRLNREPQLSDLRESGAIEQDADQVWFTMLPDAEEDQSEAILKIAKNRNGRTGKAKMSWHPKTMRFSAPNYDPFKGKF